jgi:phage shock protein PspC (stress-responsive transcriptional regulator)
MKPTLKVSIGGFIFSLDNDACQLIDDYLKKLNIHFESNPDGKDIIADVEYRMAELLQMRVGNKDGIVSAKDATDIISIMGAPNDFDFELNTQEEILAKDKNKKTGVAKRLYRDTDNRVIGGVCSGLGSYFNIDPVLVRIIFAVLLVVSLWLSDTYSLVNPFIELGMILLYIILWIAMPKAQTLEQKIAMTGKDPSIENVGQPLQKKKGSGVWKAIKIFFGIVIGIKLLSILLALIAVVALFAGFNFNNDFPSFTVALDILSLNQWDLKISALLIIVLPLIGLGYLCVKLLLWKRFTACDAAVSLLAFVVWIAACCYLGGVSLNMFKKHNVQATATETVVLAETADTLYVTTDVCVEANPVFDERSQLFYVKKGATPSIFFVPYIRLKSDSTLLFSALQHPKNFR